MNAQHKSPVFQLISSAASAAAKSISGAQGR
jgi:hypothetical protein